MMTMAMIKKPMLICDGMHGMNFFYIVAIINSNNIATYYYDENHWSNECPNEVSIVPQPTPVIN